MEFELNVQKDYCQDNDSDLLVKAYLLQFSYGIGSSGEQRKLHNGSMTEKADLMEYLEHLSCISQTDFQQSIFQLIMYSLVSKC